MAHSSTAAPSPAANPAAVPPASARPTGRNWRVQTWTLAALVLVAVLVRLAVAGRFPPHVDEDNMLLGIQTVAQKGWPLLPSDVLYLHGVTLSYLLAPLSWLGVLDYTNLFPMRAVNALCGGLAVWLTFRLARDVTRSDLASLFAAALVALDPLNVLWGGFIRMYALLQVLALVAVWLFLRYARTAADRATSGNRRSLLAGVVVACWLAVFTQVVGALLLLPLGLFALIVFGKRLLTTRRDLTLALTLAGLAPVVFLGLSTFVGHGSTTTRSRNEAAVPAASFLGDDALDLSRFLDPRPNGFQELYAGGPVSRFVPVLLVLACGLALGRLVLMRPGVGDQIDRFGVGLLLLLYWVPVTLFAFFVAEQKPRYLLFVQPFGYILLAVAVCTVANLGRSRLTFRWPAWTLLAAIGLLLAAHVLGGLWTLDEWGTRQTQAGVIGALEYIRDHRAAADVTIVGSTPESYLILGAAQPMYAMGGVLERPGSVAAGTKIDDWVGLAVIDSAELCPVLEEHPGTWFFIGEKRLDPGRDTTVITLGTTEQLYESADGYRVLHSLDQAAWSNIAHRFCERAEGTGNPKRDAPTGQAQRRVEGTAAPDAAGVRDRPRSP